MLSPTAGSRCGCLVRDAANEARAHALVSGAVRLERRRYGDVWLRDTGPLVMLGEGGGREARRFGFNGWGGKYLMPGDEAIGAELARDAGLTVATADWILEGGALDMDGTGLVVTTEQCLLNPNRNPGLSRTEIEARLARDLGLTRVLWLGQGLVNDHTDGHVDNLARFVAPGVIALPRATGEDDPNAEIYADAKRRAETFGLEVREVPSPGRIETRRAGRARKLHEFRGDHAAGRGADISARGTTRKALRRLRRCSRSRHDRPARRCGAGGRRRLPLRQPANAGDLTNR